MRHSKITLYWRQTPLHDPGQPYDKMVQDQGVDVYLAPFSDITKRYPEYAVPIDSPVQSNDPNEVYIEAVNGERFVIVVDLLGDFDTQQGKMLLIDYDVDGDLPTESCTYQKLKRELTQNVGLKGRKLLTSYARKIDGRWVECGFSFAPLEMGKTCISAAEACCDCADHTR